MFTIGVIYFQVTSAYMEDAMGNSTALTTPEEEVDGLIQEVADEHNLDFKSDVPTVPRSMGTPGLPAPAAAAHNANEEDDLAARLEALKK